MAALRSDSPLQFVRGVGPRRAQALTALGLNTVGDLLEYFPTRYELEHGQLDIADLRPGMTATIRGTVVRVRGKYPGFMAVIDDGTEKCTLRWFNFVQGGHGIPLHATVVATGEIEEYDSSLQMVQPRVKVFPPETLVATAPGGPRLVGVYRGGAELSSDTLRQIVLTALAGGPLGVLDSVPEALLRKRRLPSREQALRDMHAPQTDAAQKLGRRRLAYEEFLLLELAMALRRRRCAALEGATPLPIGAEVDQRIRARFPFALTAAQDKVVAEIARDLARGFPMTRLLQGDVGSGKTVVALYACLAAIANRRQAAIMAPTEILARQHFDNIERYLAGSRVRRLLHTGALSAAKREAALTAIEGGRIDLVVGTQALIQDDVAFDDLALVVVDEQHKFGVLQRAAFRTKGLRPHYLVMTATPIPRTLSMTVFGDLDVSIIAQSPPGRGQVVTKVVPATKWPTVMEYVRKRLEGGEQAYVVCPVIGREEGAGGGEGAKGSRGRGAEGQRGRGVEGAARQTATANIGTPAAGGGGLLSARRTHDQLVRGPWEGLRVGLLHGSLPSREKEAIVRDFAAGRLHALVATTVVEVGVDVANATIMVVEHAERYGLSQLHQLRGRVGRGAAASLCVLIARDASGKSSERLAVMTQTRDGFKIAEADLRQRGPGELLGTRQHGLPELRVGNIVDDFELLDLARRDAFELIEADPDLTRPEHAALRAELRRVYGEKLLLIDAA